jgi:hypothetical protein
MNFVESKLCGIHIDDSAHGVELSLAEAGGRRFTLKLRGVDKLLVNELRQQNTIQDVVHWTSERSHTGLRQAAFALYVDAEEAACSPAQVAVVLKVVERVQRGGLEMMEISAVYGAQMLASFESMDIVESKVE